MTAAVTADPAPSVLPLQPVPLNSANRNVLAVRFDTTSPLRAEPEPVGDAHA